MTRTEAEYNALTCVQLRAICKSRGLVQKGVKKVVIERLMNHDLHMANTTTTTNAASDPVVSAPTPEVPSTPPKKKEEEEDIGIILGSPTKVVSAADKSPVKSPAVVVASTNNENNNNVEQEEEQTYQDETNSCILFERTTTTSNQNLTPSGLHFIANHQYRPSDYTHLDNLLNPLWTTLTNCLPLSLAPNMVTTFGGLHCALAYGVLWYYSPDFDRECPNWVIALAGYCTWAYYTLDCMDGKQARRTGSSSPLGQLFDHGFDCICVLFFSATYSSYLQFGNSHSYLLLQVSLQFGFFMAQWEEYHTHVLPHSSGKWFGVTEVNYASGLAAFVASCVDRTRVFQSSMEETLAPFGLDGVLPVVVKDMETRHFALLLWSTTSIIIFALSMKRVVCHPRIAGEEMDSSQIRFNRLNALSKLTSPFLLCVAAFIIPPTLIRTRYVSVSLGCILSLLTKKMIVFSMAKMPYAILQKDIYPFLIAAVWIRFDTRLTKEGADFVLGALSVWYGYRLLRWVNISVNQICAKLDIYCFRLKKKKDD